MISRTCRQLLLSQEIAADIEIYLQQIDIGHISEEDAIDGWGKGGGLHFRTLVGGCLRLILPRVREIDVLDTFELKQVGYGITLLVKVGLDDKPHIWEKGNCEI